MNRIGSAKSGVLFGGALIVLGTILLMERLGALPTDLLRHFWPLLWIVLGVALLTGNRGPFGHAWGVILIVFGAGSEAKRLGWISFRFSDLWPLWIIALGVFLLWRALRPPDPRAESNKLTDSRVSEYAIFGGGDLRVASERFEGGNLTAVFGGHEVDLTASRIANSPAVLFADAIFGGVNLRVPPTWRVTTHGPAIFGGIESKAMPPAPSENGEQHLIVKAFAMFGGVEIKN